MQDRSNVIERRHDLDALRAVAMLAGVGLHGAMACFFIPVWPGCPVAATSERAGKVAG